VTEIATTRRHLAKLLSSSRRDEARVGLVPTMGALHAGHLRLIDKARSDADVVVVSIFVNPMQFDETSDFASYPRDLEADVSRAQAAGVDICFAPPTEEMYPHSRQDVFVDPGPLGSVLEGASRPGHFRGVATVVTKLFALIEPQFAVFGEKDYQQLLIVRRVVEDLAFPMTIVSCPTVREASGLALSSRNERLSDAERSAAGVLYRALLAGADLISANSVSPREAEEAMAGVVAKEPLATLDYAAVRDARSLEPLERFGASARLLVACNVGPVHLIDNVGVQR
jgi:pantoate--beta-alanine ligase